MKCPKCQSEMKQVRFEAVDVDRCTGCQGLWFDELELDALKSKKGSEAIDTGNPKTGKAHDSEGRINCPVCNTPMLRMVDNEQGHIWYESCKLCNGVFLDAGEFEDLKVKNFLDLFKRTRARDF